MTRSRHAEKCDLPTKSIKIGTLKPLRFKGSSGAAGRIRTADLILTNSGKVVFSYRRLLYLIARSHCAAMDTPARLLYLVVCS